MGETHFLHTLDPKFAREWLRHAPCFAVKIGKQRSIQSPCLLKAFAFAVPSFFSRRGNRLRLHPDGIQNIRLNAHRLFFNSRLRPFPELAPSRNCFFSKHHPCQGGPHNGPKQSHNATRHHFTVLIGTQPIKFFENLKFFIFAKKI